MKTICLRTCYNDKLRAREIWQELFNFYKQNNCPLDKMDNILIDYDNCLKLFDNPELNEVFIWACDKGCYYTTWKPVEVDEVDDAVRWVKADYDVVILVKVTRDSVTFDVKK